jgi:hypothetical protein
MFDEVPPSFPRCLLDLMLSPMGPFHGFWAGWFNLVEFILQSFLFLAGLGLASGRSQKWMMQLEFQTWAFDIHGPLHIHNAIHVIWNIWYVLICYLLWYVCVWLHVHVLVLSPSQLRPTFCSSPVARLSCEIGTPLGGSSDSSGVYSQCHTSTPWSGALEPLKNKSSLHH